MKKGAVAGAIVWSAPVLMSTPAFAATDCGGSNPCQTYYYAKFEGSANTTGEPSLATCTSSANGDGSQCGNNAVLAKCPGQQTPSLNNPCNLGLVAGGHTGDVAVFHFDEGVVPRLIEIKPGAQCFVYEFSATQPTPTLTFKKYAFKDGPNVVEGSPPPGCTPTSVTYVTSSLGGIGIRVAWPSGSPCQGVSHIGTYFCL